MIDHMFDQAVAGGSGADPGGAGGGVAALAVLRARLAGDRLGEQGALLDDYRRLVADQRRLAASEFALLAEIDADDASIAVEGHTTAGFVTVASGCTASAGRRRVRNVLRLAEPRWEPLADAFASGRVGPAHVETLMRAANPRCTDAICALLPELLNLADVATYERFTREVRGITDRLDQDGGYDPATDPENNRLRMIDGPGGSLRLEVDLVGELALMVRAVIEAATRRVADRHRRDCDSTAETLRGSGMDPDDVDAAVTAALGPRASWSRCGAEALAELLGRGAGVEDDDEVLLHPEAVIILHPTEDPNNGEGDPAGDLGGDLLDAEVTDTSGNPLSRTVIRFVLAAGFVRAIEFSDSFDPLRVGTTLRYANRHQRRALTIRDGGCTFPGCTRKAEQTDAHHVHKWHDHDENCPEDCGEEGPTDIDNLVLLCRHHHRITHLRGWDMTRYRDPLNPGEVRFQWRTPAGAVIYSQRHGITPRIAA